jgi:diguanylate cyclase (GGDEF)-like protein/PAS domain S-box-containing protein
MTRSAARSRLQRNSPKLEIRRRPAARVRKLQGSPRSEVGVSLFRALLESSWNAVEMFDDRGQIVYAGGSTERILGFPAEETVGKSTFDFIHPEDREAAHGIWQIAMAQPGQVLPGLFRMLHRDGSWRTIEGRLVNRLHEPEIRGIVASYRDITEVTEANRRLSEANAQLDLLANSDGLTGLANRACFDRHLALEWRRAVRDETPLSIILLDVDHFKAFNDTYGHLGGDACLRAVAGALRSCVARPGDLVARYGGEEFVCVVPATPLRGAVELAERMRIAVWDLAITHARSQVTDRVTVTVGVISRRCDPDTSPEDLLRDADDALYRGKAAGRNRCVVAGCPVEQGAVAPAPVLRRAS